tara:strand:- start:1683 stop:1937 length:255 start_codon:yes stop_codon:yes gene_type:complete
MNRDEVATRLFIELVKNGMQGRIAAKQSVELANMLINEINKDGLKSRTKEDYFGTWWSQRTRSSEMTNSPIHNGPHMDERRFDY